MSRRRFALTAICFVVVTNIASETSPHRPSMWDLASGQVKSVLEGNTEPVSSVAISPDGMTIVSGSGDYTVR